MELSLTGKKALVGGSTQGIGFAIAHELAHLGAQVTLIARNADKLAEAVKQLPGSGHTFLVADFDQPAAVKQVVERAIAQGEVYHILINNTGGPAGGAIADEAADKFISVFQQHLINNHQLAQLVLPGMKAAQYGRIINIISTSVKIPLAGLGVSNTIRGAVASWAKTLANEVAPHGITVNNVLPGATLTGRLTGIIEAKAARTGHAIDALSNEMVQEIPMKRFGTAAEVAAAAAFLASPAAAYITGINIPVDGGRTGCL